MPQATQSRTQADRRAGSIVTGSIAEAPWTPAAPWRHRAGAPSVQSYF